MKYLVLPGAQVKVVFPRAGYTTTREVDIIECVTELPCIFVDRIDLFRQGTLWLRRIYENEICWVMIDDSQKKFIQRI